MSETININAGCPACMIKNDRIDELKKPYLAGREFERKKWKKLEAENKRLRKALEYYKGKSDSRVARQALGDEG